MHSSHAGALSSGVAGRRRCPHVSLGPAWCPPAAFAVRTRVPGSVALRVLALSLRPHQWPFTLGAYAMKETHVFYSAFVLY